jgi:hypothetical protein
VISTALAATTCNTRNYKPYLLNPTSQAPRPCRINPEDSHTRAWVLDLGPWTFLDLGPWTLDLGPWTLDLEPWTFLDLGPWTLDLGPWTLDLGPWTLDLLGPWTFLDLGPWTLDLGPWTLDLGPWTFLDLGPWTFLDLGPWTLDLGPWTLDLGPWTLDLEPDSINPKSYLPTVARIKVPISRGVPHCKPDAPRCHTFNPKS